VVKIAAQGISLLYRKKNNIVISAVRARKTSSRGTVMIEQVHKEANLHAQNMRNMAFALFIR
jgi:hypothetical protein